jgi:hypothetical protein
VVPKVISQEVIHLFPSTVVKAIHQEDIDPLPFYEGYY